MIKNKYSHGLSTQDICAAVFCMSGLCVPFLNQLWVLSSISFICIDFILINWCQLNSNHWLFEHMQSVGPVTTIYLSAVLYCCILTAWYEKSGYSKLVYTVCHRCTAKVHSIPYNCQLIKQWQIQLNICDWYVLSSEQRNCTRFWNTVTSSECSWVVVSSLKLVWIILL